MSMEASETVSCPECNEEQEVTIWRSINVTLDPELREKLFNAEINHFICKECGHGAFIEVPLLYNDMDRGFCIQYYPPEAIDDPDFIATFESSYPAQIKNMPGDMNTYLSEPHLVFEMRDLLYCVLFHEKLLGGR
jgi:hypothetical protein